MCLIIVVDGVDGSGKTTLIDQLVDYVEAVGYDTKIIRTISSIDDGAMSEATYVDELPDISNELYKVLSKAGYDNSSLWHLVYSAHMYTMDRLASYRADEDPNLILFLDRSVLSFMVYQETTDAVKNRLTKSFLLPRYDKLVDWTILLSPPTYVIEKRLSGKDNDVIENKIDIVDLKEKYLTKLNNVFSPIITVLDEDIPDMDYLTDLVDKILEGT